MKPSVLPSLNEMYENMIKFGFTRDDLITLIQRRTKLSRTDIETTLDAISEMEKQVIKSNIIRKNQLIQDLQSILKIPHVKKEISTLLSNQD